LAAPSVGRNYFLSLPNPSGIGIRTDRRIPILRAFERLAVLRLRGSLSGNPKAELLHALTLGVLCWTILCVAIGIPIGGAVLLAAGSILTLVLLRRGRFEMAALFFLISNFALDTLTIILNGGARTPAITFYVALPISAAWLLGLNASLWASAFCICSILISAILQSSGSSLEPLAMWGEFVKASLLSIVPVAHLLNSLQSSLATSASERAALRTRQAYLESIVEQRTLELAQAQHEVQTAQRTKSLFLSNMSRELRTPLNAILGFSTLVRDDANLSEEHRRDLEIVHRSGEHLLTLIDQVLDDARVEMGGIALEISSVRLRDMLEEIINVMRALASPKHLEMVLEMAPDLPELVRVDAAKLRHILVKLIGNAVRDTDHGSVSARIRTKPLDQTRISWFVFEIAGTGIGISPSAAREGAGPGLSIVRSFVQAMGGTLHVEIAPALGSLVRVELPLEAAQPIEVSKASRNRRIVRLAPDQPEYRILVVENKHENSLLLERLLVDAGFEVRIAEDGGGGVEAFESWRPHLIWMDMWPPGLDVPQTVRRIRSLEGGAEVKIVALTASASTHQRTDALAAGIDDLLRKPYRREEILDCIARHLDLHYMEDAPGSRTEREPMPELTHAALERLPLDLRLELASAVVTLETNRIADLIGRISELDGGLGDLLARCASRFAYTEIFRALTAQEGGGAHAH
jgi:signal transduction histidine kinase/DNA-binding response OmpR family regulator